MGFSILDSKPRILKIYETASVLHVHFANNADLNHKAFFCQIQLQVPLHEQAHKKSKHICSII